MVNEHPYAFVLGTLTRPTLPELVRSAEERGASAEDSAIFPRYHNTFGKHASRSVLLHVYAQLVRGEWKWRTSDDIRRRVMVYYYVPTEEMAHQVVQNFRRCTVYPIFNERVSGIDVRVDVPHLNDLAIQVNGALARAFPHNAIVYSKIGGKVNYRVAVIGES